MRIESRSTLKYFSILGWTNTSLGNKFGGKEDDSKAYQGIASDILNILKYRVTVSF